MKGLVDKIKEGFSDKRYSPTATAVLNKLAGKTVCFGGRYQYRQYGPLGQLVALADAQQAKVTEELNANTHFLVLPDLNDGKALQKKAQSLNAKGASIQILDTDTFTKMVELSDQDVLALIRGGTENAAIFGQIFNPARIVINRAAGNAPQFTFTGEKFDAVDLSGFRLDKVAMVNCSFATCKLDKCAFSSAEGCNFSKSIGVGSAFGNVAGANFRDANLTECSFDGSISNADFSGADLTASKFSKPYLFPAGGWAMVNSAAGLAGTIRSANQNSPALVGPIFAYAKLRNARFNQMKLQKPDFDGADLSGAVFGSCELEAPSFRKAKLENASLIGCRLTKSNFASSVCRGSNFAEADLTDARFDGADLANCNLRGAKLAGVDLSKARNYSPATAPSGAVGPALTELDSLALQARNIVVSFLVRSDPKQEGEKIGLNTAALKHGWGLQIPHNLAAGRLARQQNLTFSGAMLTLANLLNHQKVRFETVEVKSTKSPKTGNALRALVIAGISEAFAQPLPPVDELAKATKAIRAQQAGKGAAAREQRAEYKRRQEALKKERVKKIEKTIEKQVGKVTDIATFLKALELRTDKSKIDKATKMLKADRFKLFNDVTETHLNGVVKSQTDADLVYACRIEPNGQYACCTQNLNICGGLRGSICKHLLVLIIGLVKAGELEPASIDTWIAKTHDTKPELNKETMGEIFIRYKGAEAGEVDWRPTETVPEDYYAV